MATPIAIAVVEHAGRFLIGQRPPGVPLAGYWEFPGGKIEAGESPETAAIRECREETGLEVEPVGRYPAQNETYAHGEVELIFVACRLLVDAATEPRARFHWVERGALAHYRFPAGNASLLQRLVQQKVPAVRPQT